MIAKTLHNGMNRFASSVRFGELTPLGLCGTNIWLSWLRSHYAIDHFSYDLSGGIGESLMFVVVLLAFWNSGESIKKDISIVDILAASLMFFSTLAATKTFDLNMPPELVMILLASGRAGFAWLFIRWGCLLSKQAPTIMVTTLFTSCILSAILKVVLSVIPEVVSVCVVGFFPVLSILVLMLSLRSVSACPSAAHTRIWCSKGSAGVLYKTFICFFIYKFIGALTNIVTGIGGSYPTILVTSLWEGLAALSIIVLIVICGLNLTFAQFWLFFLVFLGTSLLFVALGNRFYDTVGSLTFAMSSMMTYFAYLIYADISRHSNIHPYAILSVGGLANCLPTLTGLAFEVRGGFPIPISDIVSICLYVLLIFTSFFFLRRDLDLDHILFDLNSRPVQIDDLSDIASRCKLVGNRAGLTKREQEIMIYICQGRSRAYIAETLFISENTVRSHTQRLYLKLDVHNKEELRLLVDI